MDKLTELLGSTVRGLGYELWGIERARQEGGQLIRLYIDSAPGVTISDCEKVSRQVEDFIEAEAAVTGNYYLEVSSPGVDRHFFNLEQHKRYVGRVIKVRLRDLLEGRRMFCGVLEEVLEESLVIREKENITTIGFATVERSSLVE